MTTVEDIKKRLKQEGYDEKVVADGGPALTTQLRELVRTAGADAGLAAKSVARTGTGSVRGRRAASRVRPKATPA
jgi:methanogenic corrinoid protein MtbC1